MNADLFKANMYKNGMVGRDVANLLGIAQTTLSNKINGKLNSRGNKSEFTQSEITSLKNVWDLSDKDVIEIFFD